MAHEIVPLKADLVTSHESQYTAQRDKHRTEFARVKEQLLSALARIDSLKSEKAALMV
jgi:hypothetical protein